MKLSKADLVWNRACLDGGGPAPLAGDEALAALLRAHNMIMNGGVFHVFETLDEEEMVAAHRAYRFFGFAAVPPLLDYASRVRVEDQGELESAVDAEYGRAIPSDGALMDAFKADFAADPDHYAPLPDGD
jgi:hypothetical protein